MTNDEGLGRNKTSLALQINTKITRSIASAETLVTVRFALRRARTRKLVQFWVTNPAVVKPLVYTAAIVMGFALSALITLAIAVATPTMTVVIAAFIMIIACSLLSGAASILVDIEDASQKDGKQLKARHNADLVALAARTRAIPDNDSAAAHSFVAEKDRLLEAYRQTVEEAASPPTTAFLNAWFDGSRDAQLLIGETRTLLLTVGAAREDSLLTGKTATPPPRRIDLKPFELEFIIHCTGCIIQPRRHWYHHDEGIPAAFDVQVKDGEPGPREATIIMLRDRSVIYITTLELTILPSLQIPTKAAS